jgi:hypothetical protein
MFSLLRQLPRLGRTLLDWRTRGDSSYTMASFYIGFSCRNALKASLVQVMGSSGSEYSSSFDCRAL